MELFMMQIDDLVGWQYYALVMIVVAFLLALKNTYSTRSNRVINKVNLYFKWLLLALINLGLALLVLQPKFTSNKSETATLITEQANSVIDDISSLGSAGDLYHYPIDMHVNTKMFQRSIGLSSPQELKRLHPNLTQLHLIGDGLTAEEWQGLSALNIEYQAPVRINGLVDVTWQKQINQGDSLVISGRLQSNYSGIHQISIYDPAAQLVQQTQLLADEYFSLKVFPKVAGLHQYQLKAEMPQNRPMQSEVIAFEVTQHVAANILVIQSSPSFDVKHLKSWSASMGADLMIKTQISRERETVVGVNLKQAIESQITPELLMQFDILIMDGREIMSLTANQLKYLVNAVEQGLGLLVMADQILVDAYQSNLQPEILSEFSLISSDVANDITPDWMTNPKNVHGKTSVLIPTLKAKLNGSKANSKIISVLVKDENKNSLVAMHNQFLGKVSVSLINQTYRWNTHGQSTVFANYWQYLIKQIARKQQAEFSLSHSKPTKLVANKLASLCVYATQPVNELMIEENSSRVSRAMLMQPSTLSENEYCGSVVVNQPGWSKVYSQRFAQNENNEFWLYADDKSSWHAESQLEKIRATLAMQKISTRAILEPSYQPLNQWIYFLMIVLSMSFLWTLEKIESLQSE